MLVERIHVVELEMRTLTRTEVERFQNEFLDIASDVPDEYWTLPNFLMDLPKKWVLSFAVWKHGGPIAYAILSQKGKNRAHLHHFIVSVMHRNGGLGAFMLSEMEKRTIEIGCTTLTLKVAIDNVGAQRFYSKHGFLRGCQTEGYQAFRKVY